MAMSVSVTRPELLDEGLTLDGFDRTLTVLRTVGSDPVGDQLHARGSDTTESEVFDLVRAFVEHVIDEERDATGDVLAPTQTVDWDAVRAAVADTRTLEHAAGRAVVLALSTPRTATDAATCRKVVEEIEASATWDVRIDDPFFAFSVADVDPDFGDESRYRSKVARRVARAMGMGRRPGEPVDDEPAISAASRDAMTVAGTSE
jgi:hypothetical protein